VFQVKVRFQLSPKNEWVWQVTIVQVTVLASNAALCIVRASVFNQPDLDFLVASTGLVCQCSQKSWSFGPYMCGYLAVCVSFLALQND
jgi:hypothetical protein